MGIGAPLGAAVIGRVSNGSSPCSGAVSNILASRRSSAAIWQSAKLWLSRINGTTGIPVETAAITSGGTVAHCCTHLTRIPLREPL